MGMAIFSPAVSRPPVLSLLLAPFQELFALFGAVHTTPESVRCHVGKMPHPHFRHTSRAIDKAPWRAAAVASVRPARCMPDMAKTVQESPAACRLKIVRTFDPGIAPSCAGRMVISGRMADVCAELDRMTQKEASWHRD